jgi:DNA polymerase-1
MIYFIGQPEIVSNDFYLTCNSDFLISYFKDKKSIAVDTETEGFNPYLKNILCIQLGDANNQFVIDWNCIDRLLIKELLEKDDLELLFHNAKFDLRFLYRNNIYPKKVYDSYLAESIIYTGYDKGLYPKSLKHCVEKYCGETLDKDIRGNIHWKGLSTDVIVYAAKDVAYLHKVQEEQMKLIVENDLKNTLLIENEFVKCLAYIEMCGIRIDTDAFKKKIDSDKKLLLELEQQLNDYILANPNKYFKYIDNQLDLFSSELKCKINWNSSKQVIKFFKELGLNLEVKDKETGEMKDSVDAKVLLPQINKDPIIRIYLDYKGQEKVVSTYGDNWIKSINPITGRIHSNYTQILDTGRLSCGGKNKDGEDYINLLNIPQDNEIRNCIVPNSGYVFIDCDFTGQETVVLANKSLEPAMVKFLNEDGGDMHSFVAKNMFEECKDTPINEIKDKFKKQRQEAKAAGFAIQYGGTGITIANNLSITPEEGEKVYNAYLNAFPELKRYFQKMKDFILANGYIVTDDISRRKIYTSKFEKYKKLKEHITEDFWDQYKIAKANNAPNFPKMRRMISEYYRCKGDMERMSLNYPIQGCSASMTKIACIYVYREIERLKAYNTILFQNVIHDQIILEVPEEDSNYWSNYVQESMEKAGDLFCKTVRIKAVPEILTKWKK